METTFGPQSKLLTPSCSHASAQGKKATRKDNCKVHALLISTASSTDVSDPSSQRIDLPAKVLMPGRTRKRVDGNR
ncbi:hypothetical protein J3E68DRAFT_327738 [Trichoderma sp. SZMC 28012]